MYLWFSCSWCRSIFWKGTFFFWFTGCICICTFLYDFNIYHIIKLVIFLIAHSFPAKRCLLLFQTFWELLHPRVNFFPFVFCFRLYLIFIFSFTSFTYLFNLIKHWVISEGFALILNYENFLFYSRLIQTWFFFFFFKSEVAFLAFVEQ